MKNWKKPLLVCLCVVVVMATVVAGTLAWLVDTDSAVNTFTMGQVDISVDEAKVNTDGTPVTGADRVKENSYHLIPGQTYTKDPTLTVAGTSEEAYVRMLLTINCKNELDAIFAPDGVALETVFNGYDVAVWVFEGQTIKDNAVTYEFRYKSTVDPDGSDVVLDALFDSFTIPGTLDGDDLKSIENLQIVIEGHAIQATGFETADAAWAAFDIQYDS